MHTVQGLTEDRVRIALAGVGGTGGHVLNGLARMSFGLSRVGHPGIFVTAYDPDYVSNTNIGRQIFTEYDVGANKAKLAIDRLNTSLRVGWRGYATECPSSLHTTDILIVCVDTKKARKQISNAHMQPEKYIIDCGNSQGSGQIILGQKEGDLPNPYKEFKELTKGREDPTPDCADPYQHQDMFINQLVATYALDIVWRLLRRTSITQRGCFTSLSGVTQPIEC
jgi:PRTRC genetic system ThiF family protein